MDGAHDVVVEATGIQPGIDLAGYLVKQHGLINLVGHHYSDGGMRTVYMNQWNVKAIDVVNGHVRRLDEKMEAMRRRSRTKETGRQHHCCCLRVDCHTNGWPEDDATLARQMDRGCGFATNIGHSYSLREHPDIR